MGQVCVFRFLMQHFNFPGISRTAPSNSSEFQYHTFLDLFGHFSHLLLCAVGHCVQPNRRQCPTQLIYSQLIRNSIFPLALGKERKKMHISCCQQVIKSPKILEQKKKNLPWVIIIYIVAYICAISG